MKTQRDDWHEPEMPEGRGIILFISVIVLAVALFEAGVALIWNALIWLTK